MSAYSFLCLPQFCLHVCLLVCLCMSVYLCLLAYLSDSVCLLVCLRISVYLCLLACFSVSLSACLPVCQHVRLSACLYMPVYLFCLSVSLSMSLSRASLSLSYVFSSRPTTTLKGSRETQGAAQWSFALVHRIRCDVSKADGVTSYAERAIRYLPGLLFLSDRRKFLAPNNLLGGNSNLLRTGQTWK